MRKLLYQCTLIILNSLLLTSPCLFACKIVESETNIPIREKTSYYTPLPTQSTPNSSVTKPTSDIWDIENEDISSLNPTKKYIAFTFDDAPTIHLPKLVEVFSSFNKNNPDCIATATIFFNGVNLNEYTLSYLKNAYDCGLEVANHTYSHCDLRTLSPMELSKEIDLVDAFLEKIDGKPRHLLRAPYGAVSDSFKEIAEVPILDWSVDTLDWTGTSAEVICEKVLNGLEQGGIVLFHDGATNTIEAVTRLLPLLKEEGYQVVSISKLSKAHTCPLRTGGLYTRVRPKKG